MRFLVDAQLPVALARWLSSRGHQAQHVFDLNLAEATDAHLWQLAEASQAVLVSKDEDFVDLGRLKPGPKLLWITAANLSKQRLLAKFESKIGDIEAALEAGETLVELR